jgi:putative MATE family efflux protein
MNKNARSLRMGTMPVGKLLFSMSFPAIISMLVHAIYNVVDSYYLAQYSATDFELKALSFAFPMQIFIIAFAVGIGIGTSSLIARKLGEKEYQDASNAARTGIILAIIAAGMFALLAFTIVKPYMNLVSNIPEVQANGQAYLTIVMAFSIGLFLEIIGNRILQGMGRMVVPMITQLIGAITNIILDPILIFGRFGFPEMGIQGAAIATVIAQGLACIFVMSTLFFQRKKYEITLSFKGFQLRKENIWGIVKVGAPATLMNSLSSITILSMNTMLTNLDPSENGNAALVIYFRLQSFIYMPIFGLTQGGMPILGYNFGANNRKRFNHTFRLLILTSWSIMIFGTILFQFGANRLLQLFTESPDLISIGSSALRIISFGYVAASTAIIISIMFQAIGHGFKSLFLQLFRQMLFLVPLAFILSSFIGINGVWLAFPIGEVLVTIIFVPIAYRVIQREFSKKENGNLIIGQSI